MAAGKGPVDERSGALVELARFRAESQDPDGSDAALGWALELAPRSAEVLELAQERYRVTGNWGALTTALERSIEGGGRRSHATATHLALGEIYWRELDQVEEAERHFKRVRLSDGRNSRMLRFYVDYFGQRSDWSRVLSNLRALRTASPDEASRVEIASQMAVIAEQHLGDTELSIDIWTAARTEFPNSGRAASELRRLLRAGGKWNRLVDLLKADVAALPPEAVPEKVGLLTEMAHIYRDHFHLPVLVGNAFNQILELEPTNEEASTVLAERYFKAGRWTDLIALLERQLEGTELPERQSALLHRIGDVSRDSLKDHRSAARAYESALEVRHDDAVAIEALKAIYETHDPEALFALRRRELSLLSESRRVGSLVELVVMGEQIGAADDAMTALLESLQELSASDETATKLKGLYRDQRRWSELIEFSRIELENDASASRSSLRSLALLLSEHAPDPGAEQAIWRRLVNSNSADAEAVTMLADSLVAAGSWDELEVFAGEQGKWTRLLIPLAAHAEASEEPAIWRRLARVCAERVDDHPGQIRALRRAWELDGNDVSALIELESALGLIGDHRGRADTLRELVGRSEGAERKDLALRLASALSEELEEHEEAYKVLSEVYLTEPSDENVLRRTLGAAHSAGAVAELMGALKREAARMPAGTDRRAIYYAIVELGEGAAQSPLDAVDYLERIRAEDPYDPVLVDRLIEVYATAERWERLAELLEEVAREFDGDRRVTAVYRLVEVQSAILRTEAHPIEAIRAHGLPATSSHGLQALRKILVEREVWRPAAEVADAETESANNAADARAAQFAAAEALAHADIGEGASRFAQLIEGSPRSDEANTAASRLLALSLQLDDPASWAAAAEPALEAHERWDDLVDAIEIQQTAAPNDDRLRRLATLHIDKRTDSPAALRAYMRLGVGADQEDRELAIRLAREQGDVASLVDAWRPHITADVSVGFLSDLARLLDEDMEAADDARNVWRQAYEADPTSAIATEALERLNRSLDADEDLADHLISSAENAPPAEKAKRLREAAEILSRRVGRETEGVPLFERALELSPRDLQSYDGLEELYRGLGDDESLLDLLKRKISTFTDRPEVLASSLTTFGTTVFERGGGARVALHAYKKALTANAHHRPTIDALLAMYLTRASDLPQGEIAEVCLLIAEGYRATSDFESLILFMEARLERVEPEEARRLHAEAADLSESELDDVPRAFRHLGAALQAGNTSAETIGHFAQLGRQLGSVQEVINQLEEIVDTDSSPGDVRTELIELYLEQGDRPNAVRHLEVAAIERPSDMQTVLRLEALYRESGSNADTAVILMRKARGLPAEQAAEALREAAGLFRGVLGDPEQEADALLRLNRLDPADYIDDRLQELLESLERWEELTTLLSARAHGVEGPAGNTLRLRRATILEHNLGDTPRAIAAYRAVLERQGDEPVALARLDALYGELGMARERAAILQIRIRLADNATERLSTRVELGRLAANELGEADAGLGLYRTALEEEPSFMPALEALEEMALGEDGSPDALDFLVETHRRTGAYEEAIRVLSTAASVGARGRRVRLLDQARAIYENELRDADGAYAVALEAVHASQGNPSVVDVARRLASGTNGWTRLATVLEDVVDLNPDPGGRTEILLLLGSILKDRLDRASDAEEAYVEILRGEPHHLDALKALDEIYTKSGESGAHTAVVDALLETVNDESARIALLRRSAALHETEDDDLEASIERYEAVLQADPGDASTLARVRTLIRRTQNWPRLVEHLERILSAEDNAVGRAPILLELASLWVHELDEADAALAPLEELLRTDPGNAQGRRLAQSIIEDELCDETQTLGLLVVIINIYRSNEQWHELSGALERLA
ncbi:MAG: lipopolysaccharide biosynthesis regulator YciM, partial [Bradymonadia bacterium]